MDMITDNSDFQVHNTSELFGNSGEFSSRDGPSWYVFYFVAGVFLLLGCLGNVLIIVFFACKQHKFEKPNNNRNKTKSSQDIWFILLAATELVVCLGAIWMGILTFFLKKQSHFNDLSITQVYAYELSLLLMSWTLVGIAIDKYIVIAYPLRRRMTVWHVLIAYAVIIFCICGLAQRVFHEYRKSRINLLTTRLILTLLESGLPLSIMVTLWLLLSRKLRESSCSLSLSSSSKASIPS